MARPFPATPKHYNGSSYFQPSIISNKKCLQKQPGSSFGYPRKNEGTAEPEAFRNLREHDYLALKTTKIKLDKQFLYSFVTFAHRYMLTSTPKYITYWGDGIEASFLEFFTLFSVITEIHSSHIKEQSMIVVLFESRSAFKTYFMCACACIHLWLSVSLKSRGRKGKDSVLKVLNSPEKLRLSCLLRLLSVSPLQLLLLHCDSFKLNQSFHFLLTPLLHLFSLKITDGGGGGTLYACGLSMCSRLVSDL